MKKLEAVLTKAGYAVANVDYPSRTAPIEQLSELVISEALHLPKLGRCERVHFVTHSMGGILVRAYLARHEVPNLGRVVMLGPPNRGSEVVDKLRGWTLFKRINGPAGQELGTDEQSVPNRLGPATFEVGVVAGDRSINWINSLMITGANDGKVSVERTKVEGMNDHLVLHTAHPMMMKNREVISAVLEFLRSGSFGVNRPEKSPLATL